MGLFEEVSRFLEERLDQFLKEHPELELQMLLNQLEEQEQESLKLIRDLRQKEQQTQQEILALTEEIKLWHTRVQKVEQAGEKELAQKARLKQDGLLQQGNSLWGQMQAYKQQIHQSEQLLAQIRARKIEINNQAKNQPQQPSSPGYTKSSDPIDQVFERWELEEELKRLKKD